MFIPDSRVEYTMFLFSHIELKKDDPRPNANGGCNANSIGNTGGKQSINLARPGCMKWKGKISGTIIHEFIHKWGFWHEQTRPDRG